MPEIINGSLRMRGDRILLEPLEVEFSKVIEVIRHGRPVRGRVLAVGPGIHPVSKRVNESPTRRRIEFSKHFRPTEVKPGDVIELGGLNIFDGRGYDFPSVIVNGKSCLIVTERDVAGIVEPELFMRTRKMSRDEALKLWPQSNFNQSESNDGSRRCPTGRG